MTVFPESCTPQEKALLEREGLDTVQGAFGYAGGEELSKPGLGARRRVRLKLTDEGGRPVVWYMKLYGPDAWWRRCWVSPVRLLKRSPNRREVENIRRLQGAGVPTMRLVKAGEQWDRWGPVRSYNIVTAAPGEALERCLQEFLRRSDETAAQQFNAALLELVRRLHAAGLVHRDLYASHIFLHETADGPSLCLIDLARVFAPRWRRFRWRVKDLAQLKYSMPPQWVQRYWEAFLEGYLAGARAETHRWAGAIDRKVARMRRRRGKKALASR